MDDKLKDSKTWAYVGVFAQEMERQLEAHRERGDRPGWTKAWPMELLGSAFEQIEKLSSLLNSIRGSSQSDPHLPDPVRAEFLRRCAHVANFAMMAADSLGVLPTPRPEEEIRLALGANAGESTEDALARYTAAVRLACVQELDSVPASPSCKYAAQYLRENTPGAQLFRRMYVERLGYHVMLTGVVEPERPASDGALLKDGDDSTREGSENGHAPGCLDDMCGDCDMK